MPTDPTDTVVDALATYRLTRLLQDDQWPPVARARDRADQWFGDSPWGELLTCPWCLSPYLAVGVIAARAAAPRSWNVAAKVLAFSAVTGWLRTRD